MSNDFDHFSSLSLIFHLRPRLGRLVSLRYPRCGGTSRVPCCCCCRCCCSCCDSARDDWSLIALRDCERAGNVGHQRNGLSSGIRTDQHLGWRWRRGELTSFIYRASNSCLWPPYGIVRAIIFSSCGSFLLFLSSFFFSSPNLSRRRLDVCHTSTHGVALFRI